MVWVASFWCYFVLISSISSWLAPTRFQPGHSYASVLPLIPDHFQTLCTSPTSVIDICVALSANSFTIRVSQGSANFFCKCQSKYFRLCRPDSPSYNFLTLPLLQGRNHRQFTNEWAWLYFNKTIYKTGSGLDLFTGPCSILFSFLEY